MANRFDAGDEEWSVQLMKVSIYAVFAATTFINVLA